MKKIYETYYKIWKQEMNDLLALCIHHRDGDITIPGFVAKDIEKKMELDYDKWSLADKKSLRSKANKLSKQI